MRSTTKNVSLEPWNSCNNVLTAHLLTSALSVQIENTFSIPTLFMMSQIWPAMKSAFSDLLNKGTDLKNTGFGVVRTILRIPCLHMLLQPSIWMPIVLALTTSSTSFFTDSYTPFRIGTEIGRVWKELWKQVVDIRKISSNICFQVNLSYQK